MMEEGSKDVGSTSAEVPGIKDSRVNMEIRTKRVKTEVGNAVFLTISKSKMEMEYQNGGKRAGCRCRNL